MKRGFEIRKSGIHGKGIFALKDFKKGETIFVARGKLIHFVVNSKKDSLFGPNWMSIKKNFWLDPNEDNPLVFINHSCDANAGVKGSVTFVAIKHIKKGEEISVDYSTIELDPLWEMECECGSKDCRKAVKSIEFLPKKTYQHYQPFIPTYLSKVYNSIHSGSKNRQGI